MPRGGPDIGALLKPDEVREWRSLTVENPKSKPTAAEAAALKEKKAAEKKGKDSLLKKVVERINDSTIKKDKIKKALDKAAAEAPQEEVPRPFWLDPPSGTRDFEPAEMKVRNWLFDHMRQTAKEFGFKEYDAPVLEHVELYERKAGEEISQQMYCFTDKEGARVTLRPEMTPSLARMVLNLTNLATGEVRAALPLKWFSIPQCWRFETTQRGRKREHYQWNMDIVGEPGIVAEVELLTAVATFFKRLGVGPDIVGIRVNSRKVLDVAITKAGVPRDKFERVCVVVDKLDKIGAEAVKCMLTEDLELPSQTADVILQCLQASSVDDLAKAVGLSQSDPAIAELKTLFELCKAYGVGDYLDFDASVVRGLAYYTGVVFEAFDRKGELRAICGGGRYDRLAELYGGEKCQIPFCGFGFGDCVVVELLKDYGLMPDASPSVDVVVAPFDATMQPHALKVAASLRKAGLSVDAALTACKARKAFDLANRQGARLVAFVAPGEWARGLVRVKDMEVKDPSTNEGLQVDVPFADLASVLSAWGSRSTGAAIMMKLLIVASAASAWSLGVKGTLPKLNNRALQSTQQRQQQVVATAPASATALKATEVTGGAKAEDGLMETLKTGSFFALWYLFNIGYNIYNKKALNVLPMPWTLATLQLFAGIPYVLLLWSTGARKTPKLTQDNLKTLFPVACGHLGTHIGAVISLGAGAVSFTHIVKASEPVVSAALSAVMLGAFYSPITYLTLLPIVGGVALASLKELSFTWLGFGAAMLSNVSSALRGILAKKTMGGGVGENMNETNLYAVMTIMAFAVLLPVSLLVETPKAVGAAINTAVAAGTSKKDLAILSALSGAYYYLYNEVAFLALGRVNPVTHAVGNTIKRVVIIIASVIAFNTPISRLGVIGSSIAITGTLLYSLAKNKYG